MISLAEQRARWNLWRHRQRWRRSERTRSEDVSTAESVQFFQPEDDRLETEYFSCRAARYHVHLPSFPTPSQSNKYWQYDEDFHRYVLTPDGCWLVTTRIQKVQEHRRGRLAIATAFVTALAALVATLVSLGLVHRLSPPTPAPGPTATAPNTEPAAPGGATR